MPVAGGIYIGPFKNTGILMYLRRVSGNRRCHHQNGRGGARRQVTPRDDRDTTTPTRIVESVQSSPYKPSPHRNRQSSSNLQGTGKRQDGTHQIALALKNTRSCGHVSMLFWPSEQISGTVVNSAVFTPTCKNPERSVATACAINDARGGTFM